MGTSDIDLSLSEWSVLGLVAEGTTHGFSVARQFAPEGSAGRVWTVPRPLVYRALDLLVERGFVRRAGSAPGEGGPQRTLLEVTAEGEAALDAWLYEPIDHIRDARSHLLMKLLLIDRRKADPALLVERQRARIGAMASGLEAQIQRATGFDETLLRWRLYSVETLDRFLTELASAAHS